MITIKICNKIPLFLNNYNYFSNTIIIKLREKDYENFIKFITGRGFLTCLAVVIQAGLILFIGFYLSQISPFIYWISLIFSGFFAIYIVSTDIHPMFKITWLIPVLLMPFCGWGLYLIFGKTKSHKKSHQQLEKIRYHTKNLISNQELIQPLPSHLHRQIHLLTNFCGGTVCVNSPTKYFKSGEDFFNHFISQLKLAEKFIFLEYFIVNNGRIMTQVQDILEEKAKSGVDVRLLYDDIGTVFIIDKDFRKNLEIKGIKVEVFNHFKPFPDAYSNHRDHRKIAIIDGTVAYTGGLNLADEYANINSPYGYWKDTALLIQGEAVNPLTVMFLEMWYLTTKENSPIFEKYLFKHKEQADGIVIPFADNPLTGITAGLFSYQNLINSATKYICITTPYLIPDNETITALITAVKSGLDVRIITPHIPYKKYVFEITRSNYKNLIDAGVKIFEFKQGFIHAKSIISYDIYAIVGTFNLDYRSFYLQFENGIFLYQTESISQIKDDFVDMVKSSIVVTPKLYSLHNPLKRLWRRILKALSPFL